jgi:hypothetical protein
MAKIKRPDKQNPAFAKAQLGVATNHSSAEPSTEHTSPDSEHAQFDDALSDVGPPQDPNISGMTQTEDCYTFLAGQMDGWRENDDYRRYFENSIGCDGMLVCDPSDGDYDDNGGIPTAVGHDYGIHGPYRDETAESLSREAYPLGPVIVRRI